MSSDEIKIYFDLNSYAVDSDFQDNSDRLTSLDELINALLVDDNTTITKVEIDSYASPEGDKTYNDKLAQRRTNSIYAHLTERLSLPDSLISKQCTGIDWSGLRSAVASSDVPYRDEVLHIIDNTPEETWRRLSPDDRWQTLVDSRNKHLMDLRGGVPYKYMRKHLFDKMRSGTIVTISFRAAPEPVLMGQKRSVVHAELKQTVLTPLYHAPIVAEPSQLLEPQGGDSKFVMFPFALKTNMLYDLALTPNLELEIPIGDRWSVGAQGMYGWWLKRNNSFCWQIQAADIEGRYWFGDRASKPLLSGWFAGASVSAGFYDFQLKKAEGVQGELYVMAGLSGGYSMPLSHNLYLEFAAGVGYLVNDYQRYTVAGGKYLIEEGPRMRFQSIFPTKLEVSLSWLLFNKKRGGGR